MAECSFHWKNQRYPTVPHRFNKQKKFVCHLWSEESACTYSFEAFDLGDMVEAMVMPERGKKKKRKAQVSVSRCSSIDYHFPFYGMLNLYLSCLLRSVLSEFAIFGWFGLWKVPFYCILSMDKILNDFKEAPSWVGEKDRSFVTWKFFSLKTWVPRYSYFWSVQCNHVINGSILASDYCLCLGHW